jgi:UDP-N-acetylglucosamine 2-epimerase
MKVVTVVGARPQFVKAAPVSRALRARHEEILVHTGQHYDDNMSDVFFRELGLPRPERQLSHGGGSHGAQTGAMLASIERVLLEEKPDVVLVYGDTNSTLAGGLAAAKLLIPVAHVEAGLRSFNRKMPEETNRVLVDHVSTWLFCPSSAAVENLAREGITRGAVVVGDVMCDALEMFRGRATERTVVSDLGLARKGFALATVHRAENTDDTARLRAILAGLGALGMPVVLPLHPRTRKRIDDEALTVPSSVRAIEPQGYLDTIALLDAAALVLTDSGGLQKEAYLLGAPCVTLRDETEWTETVATGWNVLAGADAGRIARAAAAQAKRTGERPPLFGDGHAAEKIVASLEEGQR